MAEIKKYLDTTALGTLVDQIKVEDAKVLQGAKDYADGLAKNYDASGAATTAEANAKAYTDSLANGAVATNTAAIAKLNGDDKTEGSVAKAIADAKALIDADVDAVEDKADKNAEDIAAINNAESGVLAQAKKYTDDEVAEVQGNVNTLSGYVGTFTHGTAKTVVEYINAKTDGIATSGNLEALGARVTTVEGKVATIEGDYLKGADKTELEGKITAVETAVADEKTRAEGIESGLRTDVDTIKNDYLKGEDKTELSDAIGAEKERAMGVESGLDTRVKAIEDDYLKAADKEALQTQINTIMNNPDTEGVINSITEFTQYIEDHGEIAEGFRTDIDKNKEDIAALNEALGDHEALAAETYATKTELADEKKALQEEIDADVKVVADKVTTLEGAVSTKAEQSALNEAVAALQGEDTDIKSRLDAVEAQLGDGENSVSDLIATAKQEAIDAAAGDATTKANTAETNAKGYADGLNTAMNTRVEALEAVDHEHGNKALLDTYTQTEVDLADAVAKKHEHSNLAVLEGITSTKVAAWDGAEKNAKDYADGLNTTMQGVVDGISSRVGTLETTIVDKADSDDLDAAIARIATNETNIATLTSSVNSFTAITPAEVEALFA